MLGLRRLLRTLSNPCTQHSDSTPNFWNKHPVLKWKPTVGATIAENQHSRMLRAPQPSWWSLKRFQTKKIKFRQWYWNPGALSHWGSISKESYLALHELFIWYNLKRLLHISALNPRTRNTLGKQPFIQSSKAALHTSQHSTSRIGLKVPCLHRSCRYHFVQEDALITTIDWWLPFSASQSSQKLQN